MHAEPLHIDVEQAIQEEPLKGSLGFSLFLGVLVLIGVLTFTFGVFSEADAPITWGSYYVSLLLFMGLSAGGVMITAIFQIVGAVWSVSLRRFAEANVAFLPVAYTLFLVTYLGKEFLFPWAIAPRPGTEWWMQPDFVYGRFAVLLGFLFCYMGRYVGLSLRGDFGTIREKAPRSKWLESSWIGHLVTAGWQGSTHEVENIQERLTKNAPRLVICYALIYSLFSFEMIMAMDKSWMSNLFGAFIFVGNIYLGWAVLGLTVIFYARKFSRFDQKIASHQLWDNGKLTLGFCILWGYMFFSQFLPQWYGNLPEETQWMIIRTRMYPWKPFGWFVLSICFILPFILLLSRAIKKVPLTYGLVCLLIFVGIYCEKYLLVMPFFSKDRISLSIRDFGIFLGFLGLYLLSIRHFLAQVPYLPVSHPMTREEDHH